MPSVFKTTTTNPIDRWVAFVLWDYSLTQRKWTLANWNVYDSTVCLFNLYWKPNPFSSRSAALFPSNPFIYKCKLVGTQFIMARNRENMCNYGRLLRLVLLLMTFDLMASLRLNSSVVLKWGEDVQNHILTIAEEGLKSRELQKLYDSANYTVEKKDGFKTVDRVESALGDYFIKKERAARVSDLSSFINTEIKYGTSKMFLKLKCLVF